MDKSSFQKLFREMYGMNPKQWNEVLQKSGRTVYSVSPKPTKQNRQAIGSKAYDKLLGIDFKQFDSLSRKQSQSVSRPKSIRINGETLQGNRDANQRNKNANVTMVDSSAVDNFKVQDAGRGKKDVTIKFVGGKKEYLYPDVPNNVAMGMYAAPSKGSYVARVISQYSDPSNPKVMQKMRGGD